MPAEEDELDENGAELDENGAELDEEPLRPAPEGRLAARLLVRAALCGSTGLLATVPALHVQAYGAVALGVLAGALSGPAVLVEERARVGGWWPPLAGLAVGAGVAAALVAAFAQGLYSGHLWRVGPEPALEAAFAGLRGAPASLLVAMWLGVPPHLAASWARVQRGSPPTGAILAAMALTGLPFGLAVVRSPAGVPPEAVAGLVLALLVGACGPGALLVLCRLADGMAARIAPVSAEDDASGP